MSQQGMEDRARGYFTLSGAADAAARHVRASRQAAVIEHRRRNEREQAS
jgi:hypothetical protein